MVIALQQARRKQSTASAAVDSAPILPDPMLCLSSRLMGGCCGERTDIVVDGDEESCRSSSVGGVGGSRGGDTTVGGGCNGNRSKGKCDDDCDGSREAGFGGNGSGDDGSGNRGDDGGGNGVGNSGSDGSSGAVDGDGGGRRGLFRERLRPRSSKGYTTSSASMRALGVVPTCKSVTNVLWAPRWPHHTSSGWW